MHAAITGNAGAAANLHLEITRERRGAPEHAYDAKRSQYN